MTVDPSRLTPQVPVAGGGPWLRERLFQPVDTASLAAFRVMFGVLLTVKATRALVTGRIVAELHPDAWHLPYPGFDAVTPLPLAGMVGVHLALAGLGLAIALGVATRPALVLWGVGAAWLLLLDQSWYLNHQVLVVLLCGVMAVCPCDRVARLGGRFRRPVPHRAPAWSLWLLRLVVVGVYVHAGLAKLNPDWLHAQPLLSWLESRRGLGALGPVLAWDPTAWAMSYGGLVLDLVVGPALLWPRTRRGAMLLLAAFHGANLLLFDIGIFPFLMVAVNLVFLPPDWPRRWLGPAAPSPPPPPVSPRRQLAVLVGGAVALVVHAVVPLRHLAYPGRPSWTEEGHRFAWHMMLRAKQGPLSFRVVDLATGTVDRVGAEALLSPLQVRSLVGRPDGIWLVARELRRRAEAGGRAVAVYVDHPVSLNGRPAAPLIDPRVDLSRQPRHVWTHAPWILPLPDGPAATGADPSVAEVGDR